jgi:RHS repeat-associated protein
MAIDPLGHKTAQLVDALQRTQYEQPYTGNAPGSYAVYATTKYTYDYAGDLTQILHPDGATRTTYQYDMAGRKTGMTDPDRGNETYAYDQNGNPTQSIDARGAGGTVYAGFDGIDRPIWRNTTNSPSGAYDTYSYDSTASSNVGIGRLTSETFSGTPNNTLSGSDSYVYDARGRQTAETLVVGSTSYPIQATYDDAGTSLTQTYPDGETVTNSYSAQDWITGVSTSQGSTTLLSGAGYTGPGGAVGSITSANLGGTTYQFNATYDLLGRASDIKIKRSSDQATMFDQARTFDGAGNVTTASTTLPAGTDNQAFCYDEQNRLTWAGSVGTPPCTGTAISAGILTAAQYTQAFAYDTMGRLTGGPLGAYTYGNSAHVHAATSIGSIYTTAYDAAGDMTCRAPSSGVTCSGTQTGAQLGYNNEGELSNWQNTPSNPTSTAVFLYDGQGNRVAQQSTQSGTSTTTVYVGNLEQDSTTGTTTTKTTYYYANGSRIAMAVNGVFSYLASDGLGSANVTLNNSGSATSTILYAPYGSVRYGSGTPSSDFGFTGQRSDVATGLDYYGARYYDPSAGQFTSSDTVLPGSGYDVWGLSRYAYVECNPVINTDPTGHIHVVADGGGGGYYAPPPPPSVGPSWLVINGYDVGQHLGNAGNAAHIDTNNVDQRQANEIAAGIQGSTMGVIQSGITSASCVLGDVSACVSMGQGIVHTATNPGELIDYSDLSQGHYGRWVGHIIPIVLTMAVTDGVGGLASDGGEASSVTTYRSAAQTTRGFKGSIQAHHILESRFLRQWGFDVNDTPAEVLTKAAHNQVTQTLRSLLPYGQAYSRETVWKAYQVAYRSRPDWLKAIGPYFQ